MSGIIDLASSLAPYPAMPMLIGSHMLSPLKSVCLSAGLGGSFLPANPVVNWVVRVSSYSLLGL